MRHGLIVAASLAIAAPAMADITISVTPASAPNAFGSPSYAGWYANANYAIENGLSTYGAAGPSQYNAAPSTMDYSQNFVTSFNSWQGQTNPGTAFGPAYGSELGNRLAFGVHVLGNGQQFSISQLSFQGTSTDGSLDFAFNPGDYSYSDQYIGINYGADGIKGTGDDFRITSGPATQLVDELVGRGSGNAWWPAVPDNGATPELAIQNMESQLAASGPINFSGTYSLTDGTNTLALGQGSVTFVPAPGAFALLGLGGLVAGRRRR